MNATAFLTGTVAPRLLTPTCPPQGREFTTAQHPARSYSRCSRPSRPRPWSIRCCRQTPENARVNVPRDVSSLVQSIANALHVANSSRTKVYALIPGLNPAVEDTYPYSESLLLQLALRLALALPAPPPPPPPSPSTSNAAGSSSQAPVCLLFKSAGTAAAAKAYYSSPSSAQFPPIPPTISLGSFAPRDKPPDPATPLVPPNATVIFVNPVNSRGDPVVLHIQDIINASPTSCRWILLNPNFTADRSALGMAEISRRNAFLHTFVDAFYLRNLYKTSRPQLVSVECGALMHVYPGPWTIYRLEDPLRPYQPVASFDILPSSHQITDTLEVSPTRQISNQEKLARFSNDDRNYLAMLLGMAVLASALFYEMRVSLRP